MWLSWKQHRWQLAQEVGSGAQELSPKGGTEHQSPALQTEVSYWPQSSTCYMYVCQCFHQYKR